MFLLTVLQVLSNVSQVNSARLPPVLRAVYRGVALLQLQGVTLPPSCFNGGYYFEADVALLSLGLGLWAVAAVLGVIQIHTARPSRALWWTNYAAALGAVYLHPSVSSTALGLVTCQDARLSRRALFALESGASLATGGSVSANSGDGALASVSLLTRNPYILCFSEWRRLREGRGILGVQHPYSSPALVL